MEAKLEKLKQMSNECDNLKIAEAEKKGRIKSEIASLKSNYDIDGKEEAVSYLKKTRSQQLKVKNDVNERYDKLVEKYGEV